MFVDTQCKCQEVVYNAGWHEQNQYLLFRKNHTLWSVRRNIPEQQSITECFEQAKALWDTKGQKSQISAIQQLINVLSKV